MPKAIKCLVLFLSAIRLVPHIILMLVSSNRNLIWTDLDRWSHFLRFKRSRNLITRIGLFIQLMTFFPEYRTVFCLRTGLPGKLLSIFCRRMPTLAIQANHIGAGLVINHGHGTFVTATEIGENCLLDQMVTIGYNNESVPPTIGNNVTVHVGATIVGEVRIGDNSIVGANSLVISDVPSDVTVLGVPAKIIVARRPVMTRRPSKPHPRKASDAS